MLEKQIKGLHNLRVALRELTAASCWFQVTPYPDDVWWVQTKDEPGPRRALGVL
jgi:hypothetical protein